MWNQNIIFIVPIYNDNDQVDTFLKKLSKFEKPNNIEVVFAINGSVSDDFNLEKHQLSSRYKIHKSFTPTKGYGAGAKSALNQCAIFNDQNRQEDIVILSAVDLPFGFSDIEEADPYIGNNDILIGSKMHTRSKIQRTFLRHTCTLLYYISRWLMFRTKIKDSQGTFLLSVKNLVNLSLSTYSYDFFFTTELTIRAELQGLRIVEVPIVFIDDVNRKSKVSVFNDALKMFYQLIKLKLKLCNSRETA